jgi:hypothetical protein
MMYCTICSQSQSMDWQGAQTVYIPLQDGFKFKLSKAGPDVSVFKGLTVVHICNKWNELFSLE